MWLIELVFPPILQIWYVEVRISRSISESLLDFEITRVDCTGLLLRSKLYECLKEQYTFYLKKKMKTINLSMHSAPDSAPNPTKIQFHPKKNLVHSSWILPIFLGGDGYNLLHWTSMTFDWTKNIKGSNISIFFIVIFHFFLLLRA